VVPAASESNSVVQDTPLVFVDTVGYGAAVAGAGEAPDMIAKHPVSDPNTPLGVWVFGYSRVNKVRYTGTAPALGGSVVSDGS
ncbi:hypothetical protein R0J90_20700, partial [Micrococcus sp. SIMBA_144]